jgi:DNA-binding transcriptional LysR family regulator
VGGNPRDLLAALLRRELDCVVCDLSKYEDAPATAELEAVPLASEPLVAVLAPSRTDLLSDPPPSLERLVEEPWAMPTIAPSGARELPPPFAEAWAAGRFPFFRLESTAACLDLARSGRALTLVPRSLALDACRAGDLVYRSAPYSLRTRDGVHYLKHRTPPPATALMIAAIRMTADEIAGTPDDALGTPASPGPS